ncbi:MAG: DNA mismatch repair endonuclease MutL [Planctomycetota bacterium]
MSSSVTNSPSGSGAGRIKILPVQLVNKIAAGEVIERPASCIKELIENALDAQATEIEITVKEGGKKLIRIIDNGTGIVSDDLSLVFKSHSTSKIADESDLYNIQTFGFRGEALASISSVAQVRLVSKTAGQNEAYEITVDNDKMTTPEPVAGVNGTTIEITNLFYQTPARRKFLKSDSVELSHITEIITRFAIAYPEVSFSLINLSTRSKDAPARPGRSGGSDKQILINLATLPDNSSKNPPDLLSGRAGVMQRLAFFYEADISKELLYTQEEQDGVKIEAYFSLPTYTKPTSKYQFSYLNRRFIKDRIISRAIYQSYHNLIPSGRYPFVLLFLEMPASAFDVNVHPTKIEVRFRDVWRLHDQIISLIRKSLSDLPDLATGQAGKILVPNAFGIAGQNVSQNNISSASSRPNQPDRLGLAGDHPVGQADESQRVMQALVDFFERSDSAHSPAPMSIGAGSSQQTLTDIKEDLPDIAVQAGWRGKVTHTGRAFQIHNSYIIDEVVDGLLIIDQHALHERILYNRLSKQIASSEIYKQGLLIPTVVEIPKTRMALLQEVVPYLKAVGIEIEEFGENAVAIQSAPSILNNVNLKEFITEFIDAYADSPRSSESGAGDFPDARLTGCPVGQAGKEKDTESKNIKPIDNLIKMMACKGAVKAGDPLSPEEIKALIADSSGIDLPDLAVQAGWVTCPHGRPAIHKITLPELERFFQR